MTLKELLEEEKQHLFDADWQRQAVFPDRIIWKIEDLI